MCSHRILPYNQGIKCSIKKNKNKQRARLTQRKRWCKDDLVGGEGQRSCTHLTILQANKDCLTALGVVRRDTYLPILQAHQKPLPPRGAAYDLYVPNERLHHPFLLFNPLEGVALQSFILLKFEAYKFMLYVQTTMYKKFNRKRR